GDLLRERHDNGNTVRAWLAQLYRDGNGTALRRMQLVDIHTYLADCLLPKVDIATMAHGLEARSPLLDQEVLEFALGLPHEWLIEQSGDNRDNREPWALRSCADAVRARLRHRLRVRPHQPRARGEAGVRPA